MPFSTFYRVHFSLPLLIYYWNALPNLSASLMFFATKYSFLHFWEIDQISFEKSPPYFCHWF